MSNTPSFIYQQASNLVRYFIHSEFDVKTTVRPDTEFLNGALCLHGEIQQRDFRIYTNVLALHQSVRARIAELSSLEIPMTTSLLRLRSGIDDEDELYSGSNCKRDSGCDLFRKRRWNALRTKLA